MHPEPELTLPFDARDRPGVITVSVVPNDKPEDLGCPPHARGFPVCRAAVTFDGSGYEALLGWVQILGEGDPGAEGPLRYAVDSLKVLEGSDIPFGFYGIEPSLFDAPSLRVTDLSWSAESYLCFAPSNPMAREVQPVVAFEWGFEMVAGVIEVREPTLLSLERWPRHLRLLGSAYPTWTFLAAPAESSGR